VDEHGGDHTAVAHDRGDATGVLVDDEVEATQDSLAEAGRLHRVVQPVELGRRRWAGFLARYVAEVSEIELGDVVDHSGFKR